MVSFLNHTFLLLVNAVIYVCVLYANYKLKEEFFSPSSQSANTWNHKNTTAIPLFSQK